MSRIFRKGLVLSATCGWTPISLKREGAGIVRSDKIITDIVINIKPLFSIYFMALYWWAP